MGLEFGDLEIRAGLSVWGSQSDSAHDCCDGDPILPSLSVAHPPNHNFAPFLFFVSFLLLPPPPHPDMDDPMLTGAGGTHPSSRNPDWMDLT